MEKLTVKGNNGRAANHFLSSRKPTVLTKKVVKRVKKLVWGSLFMWNKFPYNGDRVSQKCSRVDDFPG